MQQENSTHETGLQKHLPLGKKIPKTRPNPGAKAKEYRKRRFTRNILAPSGAAGALGAAVLLEWCGGGAAPPMITFSST